MSGGSGQRPLDPVEKEAISSQMTLAQNAAAIQQPLTSSGAKKLMELGDDASSGALQTRMMDTAGANASNAFGQVAGVTGRSMGKYGATMNPNAVGAQSTDLGLAAAAGKSDAMNQASLGAEGMKASLATNMMGLGSGQGAQASAGFGQVAGMMGQNRMMNNQMNASAMQGLGGMGALASMYMKDGGAVDDRMMEMHAANGGYFAAPKPFQGNFSAGEAPSNMQGLMAFAAPTAMKYGMQAAKPYIQAGLRNVKSAYRDATTPDNAPGVGEMNKMAQAPTPSEPGMGEISHGVGQSVEAAPADATSVVGGAEGAAGDAAATAAAESAAADAAATGGIAALGETAADLAPLLLLKRGGPVGLQPKKRKDMKKGGSLKGPGTATSDSIPAKLSTGEYVLNAAAVKLIGKDKLDKWNRAGLQQRSTQGGAR